MLLPNLLYFQVHIFNKSKFLLQGIIFFMVICEVLVFVINDEGISSTILVACMELTL